MTKKLTILFHVVDGVGHVNACIGLAEVLHKRGHKIVFVVRKEFEGKVTPYGFQEEVLDVPEKKQDKSISEAVVESGILSCKSSLESVKLMKDSPIFDEMLEITIKTEPQIKQIVAKHKPDVYIIDHFIGSPTLIYSDKPWVFLFSGNPLFVIQDERTPPGGSG